MAEGGTRNPPRNRKGGSGHSPPKGARAEDLSRQLHAGFGEGGGRLFMGNPKRARSWERRVQPRVGLGAVEPVLYSTLGFAFILGIGAVSPVLPFDSLSGGKD